ncbi:Streptothricin hydrolase [Mycena venus]|uniref:Streptothricin hydrolase n=1 Tax=Mycena venus TaxID=2733690 RepID=A0A8H6X6M5_9AGAR|nr:Streptothricin hydrolase [Mycena venus]
MTSRRVLLVLNLQVGLISDPPQGIPAAQSVRENIALVLEHARRASAEQAPCIIHFRNCGEPGDLDEEGTPTWELLHPPLPGEFVFDKRKTNAFSCTALDEHVAPDAEVVVVGLMSEYSVKSSASILPDPRGAGGGELVDGGRLTPAEKISAQVEEELDKAGAIILDMKYLPGLFEGR